MSTKEALWSAENSPQFQLLFVKSGQLWLMAPVRVLFSSRYMYSSGVEEGTTLLPDFALASWSSF